MGRKRLSGDELAKPTVLHFPPDLRARLDIERGNMPLSQFVREVLGMALDSSEPGTLLTVVRKRQIKRKHAAIMEKMERELSELDTGGK